jgi:hypothetical protein
MNSNVPENSQGLEIIANPMEISVAEFMLLRDGRFPHFELLERENLVLEVVTGEENNNRRILIPDLESFRNRVGELAKHIEETIAEKKEIEIRRFHYDVVPDIVDKSFCDVEGEFTVAKRNNFKSPNFNFRTKRK